MSVVLKKYGEDALFEVPLIDYGATDFVTGVTIAAGDAKLMTDQQVPANIIAEAVAFTSGSEEPANGDQLDGATSGEDCIFMFALVTSGSWSGGDAAGVLFVKSVSGAFSAENLNINGGTANVLTIGGDFTAGLFADAGAGRAFVAVTASEMTCQRGSLTLIDSATKEWEDQAIEFATMGHASAQYPFDLSDADGSTLTAITGRLPAALTAGGYIKADALAISGSTTAADNAETVFDTDFATNYNTTLDGWNTNANYIAEQSQTFGDIYGYLTSNLGSAGAAATEAGGTGDHLTAIPWNAAWDAEVQSEVDDALVAQKLDHLVNVADSDDVADDSIMAKLAAGDGDWSSFTPATDALQPVRDRGDAAWTTGAGSGLSPLASGTAQGGTSGTIQLASGETFADDELNGNVVKIISGTGAGQSRVIAQNVGATDTATVTPDWTTTPSSDSVYEIVEGSANVVAVALTPQDYGGGSGDILEELFTAQSQIAAVANRLPAALTAGGNIKADALAISGSTTAADALEACYTGTLTSFDDLDTSQTAQHAITQADIATAQADLDVITGTDGCTLATAQANYAPSTQASVDDIPTVAEFEARTLAAADYFDPAADEVALVTLVTTTSTVTNNADKTGYKLASDGLDSVAITAPSGVASNFREMLVQVWRRFFKRSTLTSTELKTYADDGTTVVTTQTVSDDGTTQDQGAAS